VDNTVKVLVVDDSALMRNLISRIIESVDDLEVVARAMNGSFALEKLSRLEVDVILLDLEMPQMGGLEFLAERRKRGIDVPVVILSSLAVKGAQITMDALASGASDFILKPSGSISHEIHQVADQIIGMTRQFGGAYRQKQGKPVPESMPAPEEEDEPTEEAGQRHPQRFTVETPGDQAQADGSSTASRRSSGGAQASRPAPTPPREVTPQAKPGPTELVAIGISTGGPNALRKVFAGLDADLEPPIVVVQHMPAGFTHEFARSLDRICPLTVREATDGEQLTNSTVFVAPGNRHLRVERRGRQSTIRISDDAPKNGHRPSVDVLFDSVAEHYGRNAMAVIMTGMGKDGAYALGEIVKRGGITIGQDEGSSVVYGMPKVAYELGFVQHQVPLHEIASMLCSLAKEKRS
jgi:two-component system chemotaxis response regulator CheB